MPGSRTALLAAAALLAGGVAAGAQDPSTGEPAFSFGGHTKYQLVATSYPENSLFRELVGPDAANLNLDARVSLGYRSRGFESTLDYTVIALWGDTVELTRALPPETRVFGGQVPDDARRLFDLTQVIGDHDDLYAVQRLDRLTVGYAAPRGVVRFGRQAVSWGNGLVYTPMDIFNPFDPAQVDKEFKFGDDMLYGQLLRSNGDDLQTVMVIRRDLASGDVEADDSSLALKYHGLAGLAEYDVLAAIHYDDPLVGAGGNTGIGGAVWRGDVVVTLDDDDDPRFSLVSSMSYSWVWWSRNFSGIVEYFYNGFGQRFGDYDPLSLAGNPALVERIARGELFTLGRHYLAANALIEITPLFTLTPSLYANLGDPSALVQIVTQNDLRQNLVLLGALNLPLGADGSEFGGIETATPGSYLSTGAGIFVQLGWYF